MRITFLSQYYPPEVGAPQVRIAGLAKALARTGIAVSVHTCPPNYPDGSIKAPYRNRPIAFERDGPVRVLRSAVYPAPNRGFTRRIANHASFALSSLLSAPAAGGTDALVVETPPLLLVGSAIPYARLKRAPLVVNVADLWPESAVELGALRSRRAIRAAEGLERACYRAAAAIVCPTEGIAERLEARPEAKGKVTMIRPGVDLDAHSPAPRRKPGGPFRVLYAGTTGMAQRVGTLLDAASLLPDPSTVEILIAGDGAEGPELRAKAAGLRNVEILGTVPREQVPPLFAEADAAAILLRDLPMLRAALPTKLLEAMAFGRPVVLSGAGEAARLVRKSGSGLVVAPEDPAALASALQQLAEDPARCERLGTAGRSLVELKFSQRRYSEAWHDLLQRVAA